MDRTSKRKKVKEQAQRYAAHFMSILGCEHCKVVCGIWLPDNEDVVVLPDAPPDNEQVVVHQEAMPMPWEPQGLAQTQVLVSKRIGLICRPVSLQPAVSG